MAGRKESEFERAWKHTDNIVSPFLSPKEDKEMAEAFLEEPSLFMENFLFVPNKNGDIVPFKFKRIQQLTYSLVQKLRRKGKPIRVMNLKNRRCGYSTWVSGYLFTMVRFSRNFDLRVVSLTAESAGGIWNMYARYYDMLPDDMRPPLMQRKTGKLLYFGNRDDRTRYAHPGIQSKIITGTARNMNLGRGDGYRALHLCLAPGTWVVGEDGKILPVESMQAGDRIITHTGQETSVVATWEMPHSGGPMVRVHSWLGEPVDLTGNHPVWTRRGWILAQDLTLQDEVAMPVRKFQEGDHPVLEIRGRGAQGNRNRSHASGVLPLDRETGFLVGYYLAEGSIACNHQNGKHQPSAVILSHDHEYTDAVDRLEQGLGAYLSGVRHYRHAESRTCASYLYSAGLAEMLVEHFGEKMTKRVPDWVWYADPSFGLGIVEGYLSGDGSRTYHKSLRNGDSPMVTVTSIRSSLVTQVRDLVASLGVGWGALTFLPGGDRHGRQCQDAWVLRFSGQAARTLRSLMKLPPSSSIGKPWLEKYRLEGDTVWIKLKSLKQIPPSPTVWNLMVQHSDHSFRTPHFSVKNSEVSFWENAGETLRAILKTVPDRAETFVFQETTSNGMGGDFYDEFMEARRNLKLGEFSWYPQFLPSWLDEDCHPEITKEQEEAVLNSLDDYEISLQKRFSMVTPNYLWWRRKEIAENCQGSKAIFDMENAPSVSEAFVAQGQSVFPPSSIEYYMQNTMRVGRVGRLIVPPKQLGKKPRPHFVDDGESGFLTLWEFPQAGMQYCIGADASMGQRGAEAEKGGDEWEGEGTDSDYCAAVVMDQNARQVGELRTRMIDPESFADEVAALGYYFNEALVMPEVGVQGAGIGMMYRLKDVYTRIGLWEKIDSSKAGRKVQSLGWEASAKGQPYHAPILTPEGWRPMGSLHPGDRVHGRSGWTQVLGVYELGERPCYRVTFSDGSSTEVTEDHYWAVRDRKSQTQKLVTTEELLQEGLRDSKGWRWGIPLHEGPVQMAEQDLPLEPYTLGMLLGNGGFTNRTPKFSSCEKELVGALCLPEGVTVREIPRTRETGTRDWLLIGPGHKQVNPLTQILKDMDLWDRRSVEKHIPEVYLKASADQRLSLLQGLMDTDGSVNKQSGGMVYSTGSEQLAKDVQSLVWSLGGLSRRSEYRFNGHTYYRVTVNLPYTIMPFRLYRKRKRVEAFRSQAQERPTRNRTSQLVRSIVSITPEGSYLCRCIQVDASDGLYTTENYILTHNTKSILLGKTVRRVLHGAGMLKTDVAPELEKMPKLVIRSRELLKEMASFATMRGGSYGARHGSHDDLVIALAMALLALKDIERNKYVCAGNQAKVAKQIDLLYNQGSGPLPRLRERSWHEL